MYRQIRVVPEHTPYQRILFRRDETEEVQEYELQTVTFGINCAPYLAIRTLLQLASDVDGSHPLASDILRNSMYVDDVLAGAHTVSSACAARDELREVLKSAGFELRKWASNHSEVLADLPPEHLIHDKFLALAEASNSRTLGIHWNAQSDYFFFKTAPLGKKIQH